MLLPVAMSDAFIAGASAIVGAIVGATAGGTVDWILESHREKTRAKAGARLVAGDLAMADSRLKSVQGDDKWWTFFDLSSTSWSEYKDVLAVRLSNDEFERVSQAVVGTSELSEKIPLAPVAQHGGRYLTLSKTSVEGFAAIREDVADAYNALAALAGHERVDGTVHGQVSEDDRAKARADDQRRGSSPTSS